MFDSDICKKKDGSPLKTYESEYEALLQQEPIEKEQKLIHWLQFIRTYPFENRWSRYKALNKQHPQAW